MKLFKYLKSMFINSFCDETKQETSSSVCKEIPTESIESTIPKIIDSKKIAERLLTVSQAAKTKGITRQAIFFAIKMNRLNAKKENNTWLITESDLKDYFDSKYSRSKSRKEGELIFDKSKGFFSITEAAQYLNKNTNHIYYLVRMGKLKSHRQGSAIVIRDDELYKYAEFSNSKTEKNLNIG